MKVAKTAVKSDMPAMDDDWKTEDDMRTMMRAEEIKGDPVRLKKVHAKAGRHVKAIKSIQDIKDTYAKKFGAGSGS